jgi:hypothetical protein
MAKFLILLSIAALVDLASVCARPVGGDPGIVSQSMNGLKALR